jgi:catechol 2,3-dioxygenase-like lactoylglutathione lyase family enzyme
MFKDTRAYSGFSVNDLQKAKAFYGQTLGLEVSEADGQLELQVAGGTKILVYPKSDQTPATFRGPRAATFPYQTNPER